MMHTHLWWSTSSPSNIQCFTMKNNDSHDRTIVRRTRPLTKGSPWSMCVCRQEAKAPPCRWGRQYWWTCSVDQGKYDSRCPRSCSSPSPPSLSTCLCQMEGEVDEGEEGATTYQYVPAPGDREGPNAQAYPGYEKAEGRQWRYSGVDQGRSSVTPETQERCCDYYSALGPNDGIRADKLPIRCHL